MKVLSFSKEIGKRITFSVKKITETIMSKKLYILYSLH